jgi:DNA polymerase III epsilon subunit-like protein
MEVLILLGAIVVIVYFSSGKKKTKAEIKTPTQRPPEPNQTPFSPSSSPAHEVRSQQVPLRPSTGLKSPPIQKRKFEPFEFCALDTETTGIVPKSARHRAFEISAVKFSPDGNGSWSKKRFTRYIKVDPSYMKGLKLSPMWNDHVSGNGQANAVEAVLALSDLRAFAGNLPIVCHNAKFDKCVIENEIEKTATSWKLSNRWICTLEMARAGGFGEYVGYSPGREDGKSYRLMDVARTLRLDIDAAKLHHGYYDAELAGTILLKLHHVKSQPLKHFY